MDEREPIEGMHMKLDVSVWRKRAPLVWCIIGKTTLLTALTVAEILVAVSFPLCLHVLGTITADEMVVMQQVLGAVFVLAGYTVAGVVWWHYAYSAEEVRKRRVEREPDYLRRVS